MPGPRPLTLRLVPPALLLAALCLCARAPAQDSAVVVSDSRYANLGPGLTLGDWFFPVRPELYDAQHVDQCFSETELDRIQSLGFRHLRLPVAAEFLYDARNPDVPLEPGLASVDAAIDKLLARGFSVTVVFEPDPSAAGGQLVKQITEQPKAVEDLARCWTALARHWNNRNPDRLFFGIFDGPETDPSAAWEQTRMRLLRALREGAPLHTIVLDRSGAETGWPESVPAGDFNVVYCARLSQIAEVFCRQGTAAMADVREVPYPASPKSVIPLVKRLRDMGKSEEADLIEDYGDQRWDRARLEETLRSLSEWSSQNHCRMIVSDIGVSTQAPAADRLRFLRDVREILDKLGIRWNLSDGASAAPKIDLELAKALGLKPSPKDARAEGSSPANAVK